MIRSGLAINISGVYVPTRRLVFVLVGVVRLRLVLLLCLFSMTAGRSTWPPKKIEGYDDAGAPLSLSFLSFFFFSFFRVRTKSICPTSAYIPRRSTPSRSGLSVAIHGGVAI